MRIIYCGDVVGRSGREVVLKNLAWLRQTYKADLVLVNVENSAHGFGATPGICKDFLLAGADGLLMGNHTFDQPDILPFLDEDKRIIRPLNYPEGTIGRGFMVLELLNGKKVLVVQLLGRLYMESFDCPAQSIEKLLKTYQLGKNVSAIVVDIHAEATSEKYSMGHLLDGRVSLVAGTHTHVPTSDAHILPNQTAYITDVGMCGNYQSVLGFEPQAPVARLCRKFPSERLTPAKGEGTLCAVLVETDNQTGLALKVEQIIYPAINQPV